MTFYFQILLESLHHASIVPFGSEPTFYAMRAFGNHNMIAPTLLAVIGATLGHIVNWYVGRTLIFFEHKGKLKVSPHWYERTRNFFDKYGIFLLLLSWMPLCNLLVVMAGFLKLPLKKVLLFVIVGLAAHYGVAIL